MWLISRMHTETCLLLGGGYWLDGNYSVKGMFVKERCLDFEGVALTGRLCLSRCDHLPSGNPGQNSFCLTQANLWCSSWSSGWPIPHSFSLSGWKCCSVAVVLLVGCRCVLPAAHLEQRSLDERSDG